MPSGTPVFDAASWNGIAIDSTCGGYGTCKKCKVRIVSGEVPVGPIDPRAFTAAELADGWRLACRAAAREDLVVEVPPLQTRPKAALVGVGRHVILRPSVQKRHLVLEEPTLEDQRSGHPQRVLDAIDDLEPVRLARAAADARRDAARIGLRRDRGGRRRGAARRRAGRHDRTAVRDRLRPRDDDRRRDAARSRHRAAARGPLDAQPPAAVRRRRDHADLGDDDGPRGARQAAASGRTRRSRS